MIHHLSLSVSNPAHVANVLAEIWQGKAYPFPVHPGSYIVFEGNTTQGTCLELYPKGTQMKPGQDLEEAYYDHDSNPPEYGATHIALSVPVSIPEIEKIAQREGWRAVLCDRGPGCFHVVEFWVENCLLLELITPDIVNEYLDFMKLDNWEEFLAQVSA